MDSLVGPALVVAGLLVLAGAQKVLDPIMTVGALRALGLPASGAAVRLGSAGEALLGLTALAVGGPAVWALVAASYVAFAVFVTAALRGGSMIGTCGCFGREETPPHAVHVVLNVVLAALAAVVGVGLDRPALEALGDDPAVGLVVAALAVVGLVLLHAAFVALPRALWEARRAPGPVRAR